MSFYQFGIGFVVATPFGSNAAGSPTPTQLITLQDIGVDFSYTNKPLMGQLQFPVAVARAEGKVDMKCKFAGLGAKIINDLMFGGTVAAGGEVIFVANSSQTPSSGSFTITPAGGTFLKDQGVIDSAGNQLTLTTSAPASGSYEVNNSTGVYTVNSSQPNTPLLVSYLYTATSGGFNAPIPNKPMGQQPLVNTWVSNSNWSNSLVFNFPSCIFTKMGLPQKNTDWTLADMELSAFSDALSNLAYLYSDK